MKATIKNAVPCLALVICASHGAAAGSFSVVGKLARDYTVSPGMTIAGRIIVKNNSIEPVEVQARQTDYLFQSDGTNAFPEPGTVPRSNAPWIEVSPQQLVIPPNETLSFSYRIDVPDDSSLDGSYWSMVLVSPVIKPYTVEEEEGKAVLGIQSVLQYGIQIATHLSGTGTRDMRILESHLEKVDGWPQLALQVANAGTTMIRPEVWVELFDEQGVSAGRFDGSLLRIYPGCSVRILVPLNEVGTGKYTALLVADLGGDDLVGTRYNLDID